MHIHIMLAKVIIMYTIFGFIGKTCAAQVSSFADLSVHDHQIMIVTVPERLEQKGKETQREPDKITEAAAPCETGGGSRGGGGGDWH